MKSSLKLLATAVVGISTLFMVACDWSSGGDSNSYNTSNASNLSNISGFYQGTFASQVVRGSGITHLTVQQSGNRIEIVDSNGAKYTGTVGSPVLVANLNSDIGAGSQVASYQLSFSGNNVDFTGVVNLVAVTDIQGHSRTVDQVNTDGSGSSNTTTETSEVDTPQQVGVDGVEPGQNVVTENITTSTSNNTETDTQTTVNEFELTDSNTQLRMRGTWIQNGAPAALDALAAGIMGNVTGGTTP
ncbi:MAG: hypothetical protein PF795_00200 [Kiritimatiellae bacterium]|jgi:hypothetical protein|nr:hypothetical protein [Kiritimatiellia bacterium]